ncbi:uncharacterized protein LOC130283142 [Hyla sarda]|uniref:uncharacterized protein LOC130283142 n=1 Tax=Hyla sarda TaxID=327740 RepID=UPI0024C43E4B|nr:uncharacterized protein LOC130283142 [Hyla sarda]
MTKATFARSVGSGSDMSSKCMQHCLTKPLHDLKSPSYLEDLPNETITTPAKEILCITKIDTQNEVNHSLKFRHFHDMEDHKSIIATESSQEASLHHSTMESEIDQTAELLPSGSIQSLQNGIKKAVTETSPLQLIGSDFIPKANDYLMEEEPSLSIPKYFQAKSFIQQSRSESIKWIPSSMELPESVLDIGEIEPHGNVTADLYSDGTWGPHGQTPDLTENIKQNVDFLRKSDDHNNEDLYTDSKFFEEIKELIREIPSKREMTDDIMFKNKVWNIPNPENIHRKGTDYQIRCTKKGEYIETGHGDTDEGTFMCKSTEHESQANSALYPHAVTSQYVPMLHESKATDDIKLKSGLKLLRDRMINDDFIGEHNACHEDQTAKSDNRISKEVNQCESEVSNDKTQKDKVYLKRINKQKLEIESDALKAFDKYADSKETYNHVSGITSICNVPYSQVTFLSVEGISNKNTDNPPQSSSETLSCIEEKQSLAKLNISTCASHEDKMSYRDTEDQPQICSNNDGRKGAIKIKHFEARNSITNQLEFQRDPSTMCPEKVDTSESTSILKELSSSQSHEISGISPGHDLIASKRGITIKDCRMSSQKVENSGIKTLFKSCSEEKLAPCLKVIDQQDHVSSNTMYINMHHSMDDSNIKEVKKESCHSPDINCKTPYGEVPPEKEVESGSVLETKSNKDNNVNITVSQMISNESIQINNLQVFSRSSDQSLNSTIALDDLLNRCTATISNVTNRCTVNPLDPPKGCKNTVQELSVKSRITCHDPSAQFTSVFHTSTYQGTNSSSDSSDLCTKTSTDQSDNCKSTMSDVSSQDEFNSLQTSNQSTTMNPDSTFKCSDSSLTLSNQCTSSFLESTNQCKPNASDLAYDFTGISPEPLIDFNTTAQDPSIGTTMSDVSSQDEFNSLQTSDQSSTMNPDSAIRCCDLSDISYLSDSTALCAKTSTNQSDHCRTTLPDSSYQGKFNYLHTADQCSAMNPDSTFKCSDSSLTLSNQCTSSLLETTNPCKPNASDLAYDFTGISPEPFINFNTTAQDPSKQFILSNLDSAYHGINKSSDMSFSSDSSTLCMAASSDTFDQFRTTTGQIKISSRDASDQFTTINPMSALDCSVPSLITSDQCTTSVNKSTNQCKKHLSDLSHQCTLISSDLSNQYPSIATDFYQSTFTSVDPPEKYTARFSDLTYTWTNNLSDVPKHTATSQHTFDQDSITSLDQSTTMTYDPTDQLKWNSSDSSYENAITSLDLRDQGKTTSLNSPEECKTIFLDSSNPIPSFPESKKQHTSSQTPPHHLMTNSFDLHDSSNTSCQTALPKTDVNNKWVTNTKNPSLVCRISSTHPHPQNTTLNSDQSLKVSASTSDSISDCCTTVSSDDINKCITTSSDHSVYEDMETTHRCSYQYTADFPNYIDQFTNTSPNQYDRRMANSTEPFNQCATCTSSSHQCRTMSSNVSSHCTAFSGPLFSLPNSLQLSSPSTPDLCGSTTTSDLPDTSMSIFGGPDLPCTTISPFPSCQHATTSTESSDQCTNISVDFHSENNIEWGPLQEPIQDEHGGIIKQCEFSFLEEVRRIFLDSQVVRISLLDTGIILIKEKHHLGNIVLMVLRNGKELGTVIQSSNLYLHYQLDKHFLVTQQLNDDWYRAQDRITKVTMLMKKVPITSNWLKTLHNFLCLPNGRGLLTPYAVITDRNGSILFLMEDRDLLGVGIPPLRYELNTMKNLSEVLSFMKYCKIHRVLPGNIINSILYTPQGICFDPSSFCNNEDLCEFKKCLKECLLVFLFSGQLEEFDGIVELLLERGQVLLEEDWSPQICLARLLTAPVPGTLPFCFPSFSTEN